MNISDEAVTAAAKALYADNMSNHSGGNAPQIIDACEKVARKLLESAAPYLMAQAFAEGHESGFWNGRLSHGDPEALTGIEHEKASNPYRNKEAVEAAGCSHYEWTGTGSAYECPADARAGSAFCVGHGAPPRTN